MLQCSRPANRLERGGKKAGAGAAGPAAAVGGGILIEISHLKQSAGPARPAPQSNKLNYSISHSISLVRFKTDGKTGLS
jgi:hypothetical protein